MEENAIFKKLIQKGKKKKPTQNILLYLVLETSSKLRDSKAWAKKSALIPSFYNTSICMNSEP